MSNEQGAKLLDRLWTIYSIEQIGTRYFKQLNRAGFMAIVEPHIGDLVPDLYLGGVAARDAAFRFFIALRYKLPSFPAGWLSEFRAAFDRGEIDSVALGALTRKIYCGIAPEPNSRGEHHAQTLSNFRLSDIDGRMLAGERQFYESLPDSVMLYRGAIADTPSIAARGISWTLHRSYATAHLYRRCMPGHVSIEIRKLLGIPTPPPQLVTIAAPKSAILAYRHAGDGEVFVDFEAVDLNILTSLPTTDLLYQSVAGKIQDMHRTLLVA